MNKEETLALFAQGRDAWNAWATPLLDRKSRIRSIVSPGSEDADFSGHTFVRSADFSGFIFPGAVSFNKARFEGPVKFTLANFKGTVRFEAAIFLGEANFNHSTFSDDTYFHETEFQRRTEFDATNFDGEAQFNSAKFQDQADFSRAKFSGQASFDEVEFRTTILFDHANFKGDARFVHTDFQSGARFSDATFGHDAWFGQTQFRHVARFSDVKFHRQATFSQVNFEDSAFFFRCRFESSANFSHSDFQKEAIFELSSFSENSWFEGVWFRARANFLHTRFKGFASFENALFSRAADFVALNGDGHFSLANATFSAAPDFSQAHFSEAPRLDNATFPRAQRGIESAAMWRSLRKLALQGHDHERELTFFANEMISLRGSTDWGIPSLRNLLTNLFYRTSVDISLVRDGSGNQYPVKQEKAVCRWGAGKRAKGLPVWSNGGRYWMGVFYQGLSDFGRSMLRPVAWWMAITAIFTATYLGASALEAAPLQPGLKTLGTAWANGVTCTYGSDDALGSAVYLALSKGLVITGIGTPDSLNHAYVCLYGVDADLVQLGGQKLVPKIPLFVAFLGILQTVFSATLIFLFLLAVRNHFRIR